MQLNFGHFDDARMLGVQTTNRIKHILWSMKTIRPYDMLWIAWRWSRTHITIHALGKTIQGFCREHSYAQLRYTDQQYHSQINFRKARGAHNIHPTIMRTQFRGRNNEIDFQWKLSHCAIPAYIGSRFAARINWILDQFSILIACYQLCYAPIANGCFQCVHGMWSVAIDALLILSWLPIER